MNSRTQGRGVAEGRVQPDAVAPCAGCGAMPYNYAGYRDGRRCPRAHRILSTETRSLTLPA